MPPTPKAQQAEAGPVLSRLADNATITDGDPDVFDDNPPAGPRAIQTLGKPGGGAAAPAPRAKSEDD